MDAGNENFTTKEKKFSSLLYLSALLVYYNNLNTMYNMEKTVVDTYYCCCFKYSGCKKINGVMHYCDLCQLNIKHNPYENEKDYKVKNLINKNIELTKDFKKYNVNIYTGDYISKSWNPVFSEWSFYDSVFNNSLFIKKKIHLIKFFTFYFLVMTSYQPSEERKENLAKCNPSELKEKITALYGSDSKIDKVIWELVPNYFKIKLPHLEILSIHLKTNEVGNEIKISVFFIRCIIN